MKSVNYSLNLGGCGDHKQPATGADQTGGVSDVTRARFKALLLRRTRTASRGVQVRRSVKASSQAAPSSV
jgi:hypothetical protein